PFSATSLRRAAWAGLQDSMPRAALLSLHARVERVRPTSWEHASLAQVWGPRFSTYVVAARGHAIFTVGRRPEGAPRAVAGALAPAPHPRRGGGGRGRGAAVKPRGLRHENATRYPTPPGRLRIGGDATREATIWPLPPPGVGARAARLE